VHIAIRPALKYSRSVDIYIPNLSNCEQSPRGTVCKLSADMKEQRGPTGRFVPLVAQPYIHIQES